MHVVKPTRRRAASLPPSCALAHASWPAFLSTQVSGPLNSHRRGGRGGAYICTTQSRRIRSALAELNLVMPFPWKSSNSLIFFRCRRKVRHLFGASLCAPHPCVAIP